MPKVLNINPRSVYNKSENLKTFIKEHEIDVVCISESWEREDQRLDAVLDIDNFTVISNPFVRKRGEAGGRPAIMVNSNKFTVDNSVQSLVTAPPGVEMVFTIIKPHNTNNSSIVKRIFVGCLYSKPNSRKKSILLDFIAETFHLLSSMYPDAISWIIAGDSNDLKLTEILNLNKDFKQCVQDPTRLQPPAILDIIITDISRFYQTPECLPPLEADEDTGGSASDHLVVVMTPLDNFNNKKRKIKKTVQFRPLNEEGFKMMESQLQNFDWETVVKIDSVDEQAESLQHVLFDMFETSFPMKTKTFLCDSEPWYTEKLAAMKRRKSREFYKHRKSEKYLALHKTYKDELSIAKKSYYSRKIQKLRSSNPRMWYRQMKSMMTNNNSSEEVPEVEDIKDLPDTEQAEKICEKFSSIANEYEPLDRSKIDIPHFTKDDILVISVTEVEEILKNLNTNKSVRKNDVPPKIFKYFHRYLAQPLTSLINNALEKGVWPDMLKLEIVTPIPKVPHPQNVEDLRNISGLLMLNKIFEKAICPYVISDMKATMDPSQFGNLKGVSVQHYLIKMLDRIHNALDGSNNESTAVLACYADWKQAFNRQDATLVIKSLQRNGVRSSLLPIAMSFFENRRMKVKWHSVLSETKPLDGGGPQGSSWGVISYLSQTNDNANNIPVEDRYKYFDDLSFVEKINLKEAKIENFNFHDHVSSEIPDHNQIIKKENLKMQSYINDLNEWTENNLMKMNAKKTKIQIFNFSKKYQFTTDIQLQNESLEIVDMKRILGVYLTSNLKWDKQVDVLIKSANIRMKWLHAAKKFTDDRKILKQLYTIYIRSILENAATVWHSGLTQGNIEDLERLQKSSLKVMCGKNYSTYEQALKDMNMESLNDRRTKLCVNFIKKSIKLENFKELFPENKNINMNIRNHERYYVKKYKTERCKKSSVPYFQSLMNKYVKEQKDMFSKLLKSSSLYVSSESCHMTARCENINH